MAIAIDTINGKILDEACNQNNDAYSDEVLYAAWADAPRDVARQQVAVAAPGERNPLACGAAQILESFMARLSTCQR